MIAVLNQETAAKYVKEIDNGMIQVDETLCSSSSFRAIVYNDMMECAVANKLNSLEKPKQFRLLLEPFSVENDLLTPTMKLKRHQAKNRYLDTIGEMY
jgi:long-chain acyl-CoA synthetase